MKRIALALALLLLPALAFAYPFSDLAHRGQVSVSSGYLRFQSQGSPAWQGVDIAPALTYSAHSRLSLFAQYGRGFPLSGNRAQSNQARVAANLLVYPGPSTTASKYSLSAGAGPMWLGTTTLKDEGGLEAHLTGTAETPWPRVALYGTFTHLFPWQQEHKDIDQIRAGLNLGIWP